jgi:hypothetical protein
MPWEEGERLGATAQARERERARVSARMREDARNSQPNETESMNRAGGKRPRLPGLQPAVHNCMTGDQAPVTMYSVRRAWRRFR